jgi:phosphohistidine swiveling domain-containing protein
MSIAEHASLAHPVLQDIAWEEPGDAQVFWQHDRMHFPQTITVLEDDLIRIVYAHGHGAAAAYYGMPVRMHGRRFFAHHYVATEPTVTDPAELEVASVRVQERVSAALPEIRQRWEQRYLPEVLGHIQVMQSFTFTNAAMPDLLAFLDETIGRLGRLWHIHFEATTPAYLAMSLFEEFYRDIFPEAEPFEPYELLQGFDNKTLEIDRELWRLSRRARMSPIVRGLLLQHQAEDVLALLDRSDEGLAFHCDLLDYLDRYGQRGETWGFAYPTWSEDPTPVIRALQVYVRQPNRNIKGELDRLVAQRAARVQQARERLTGYPEAVRGQFELLLRAAQEGVVLSEDHGFYIDFWSSAEIRRIFMELGRRFAAAGAIAQADDIFHLRLAEIGETAAALPPLDRRALVAERRAEIARYAGLTPPPFVGTPPDGPPPDTLETRTMLRFFGGPAPAPDDPSELLGSAGSPGQVRGRARIIRNAAEAGILKPGDILVAETTAPPWTPLFAIVAGVVTDTGGVLSHCAVVAREYQIPAVVGTGLATSRIPDGAYVEIDGTNGRVRILS